MLRSTTLPAKSASDLGLPSLSAKAISGRSSGFGLSRSGAIGPLLRPASGPARGPAAADDPDPEIVGLAIVRRGETHIYRAESGNRRNDCSDEIDGRRRSAVALFAFAHVFPLNARLAQAKTVMTNTMWGGRFAASPAADHGGDKRLHRLRQAAVAARYSRLEGACRHARRDRHHHGRRGEGDRRAGSTRSWPRSRPASSNSRASSRTFI